MISPEDIQHKQIIAGLESCGVNTSQLIVVVRDQSLLIAGAIDSGDELHLIQTHVGKLADGRDVELDIKVQPFDADLSAADARRAEFQLHQLRNRMNRLLLGIRLLQHTILQKDISRSHQIVQDLLAAESDIHQTGQRQAPESLTDKQILVVEDDVNQCLLLSDLLRQMGATVTQTRSAESARTLLQCRTMPDVILVDLQLIGENGQRFAQWLRREYSCTATRLVAVSATRPARNDGEPDPFDQWLPKPINIDTLLAAIQE